jgi:uncharacterized protein YecE (DUF72 family)
MPVLAKLYVGPSGWSYPDWEGIVYPRAAGSRFDPLAYLARFFNAVEVNSSFYRPPTERMTASWAHRTAERQPFRFAVKLHQRFTHERDRRWTPEEARIFRRGIQPLIDAGVLGPLLWQFPWSFRWNAESVDWLRALAEQFADLVNVVEVRHAGWDNDDARELMGKLRLNLCNIDQPALPNNLPPAAHVTGPVGYVRFHGRRRDTWFADNVEPHARYDYLYREDELNEWLANIRHVADQAESTYVFTNNHYRGQGPANALQLRAMLERGQVAVPPEMIEFFPFLGAIARPIPAGDQPKPPPGRKRKPAQPGLFDDLAAGQ